ncbi:MAG: PD40 domain-containing protein [Chloroflexi bacterium]|nr:PD40 domain-containing protein [Chloroflexota bacterium]
MVSPFGGQGTPGGDIVSLDLRSGALAPLVPRSAETESLTGPMWLPDGTTLVFQREDLSVVGESYAGMSRPVYPSRIELARTDTGRSVVIGSGRQPAPAPDGSGLVFVRTTREGTAMLVRSPLDGEEQVLIPQGTYLDIASPRYAPQGDRIAFMVPENPVSGSLVDQVGQLLGLEPVYAHGFPWDLWIMNKDATGVHRLAQLAADDGTVSWSPDGRELFVHGGTGSFLVDATSGDVTPLTFIAGYGTSTWLPDSDS